MSFANKTVILDADGTPWMYFDGHWSSNYSIKNKMLYAHRFDSDPTTIEIFGLTTEQLMSCDYGPWRLVTETKPIMLLND